MASISDLPNEIILMIFRMYLNIEDQNSLMKIIYNVCSEWRRLCFDSSLWTNFDGSVPFKTMVMLYNQGSFRNTRYLTHSKDTASNTKIYPHLYSLKIMLCLDFNYLEAMTSNFKYILPKLETRPLLFESFKECTKINDYDNLLPFLSVIGSNLLSINLSNCTLLQFQMQVTMQCIADNCQNLEQLNLMQIDSFVVFPTDIFQEKCKKLKELHLDHNICLSTDYYVDGFPNLEAFTFRDKKKEYPDDDSYLTYKTLKCVVFNSLNLKFLDLTRSYITAKMLCSCVPATNLQSLFVARSTICKSKTFPEVFKKWCSSLKYVDISFSPNASINTAVMNLVSLPTECQLEDINLAATKVTDEVVEQILQKCDKLQHLNLKSCERLDCRIQKDYYGEHELYKLSKRLKSSLCIKRLQRRFFKLY